MESGMKPTKAHLPHKVVDSKVVDFLRTFPRSFPFLSMAPDMPEANCSARSAFLSTITSFGTWDAVSATHHPPNPPF